MGSDSKLDTDDVFKMSFYTVDRSFLNNRRKPTENAEVYGKLVFDPNGFLLTIKLKKERSLKYLSNLY